MRLHFRSGVGSTRFSILYILEFLVSVSIAFPTYVLSSFLAGQMPEVLVGLLYAVSAVLTFVALSLAPRMLRAVGMHTVAVVAAFLIGLTLFEFAFPVSISVVVVAFVGYSVLIGLLFFVLDMLFEAHSVDEKTGGIRGNIQALSNLAFFTVPLVISFVLTDGDYYKVFLMALSVMVAVLFVLFPLRMYRDGAYRRIDLREAVSDMIVDRELRTMFLISVFLRFASALIMIYVPIYLYGHLGFSWTDIGRMFAFMLVPSLMFSIPAGRISDSRLGEKELLLVGFLILGLSTMSLSLIGSTNAVIWASALFVMRFGTGLAEVMADVHFFKRISSADAGIISLFRNANQVAYLLVAVVSSLLLLAFPLRYLFFALGVIVLAVGMPLCLSLRDTK